MVKNSKPNAEPQNSDSSRETGGVDRDDLSYGVPRRPLLLKGIAIALGGWMIFLAIVAFTGI